MVGLYAAAMVRTYLLLTAPAVVGEHDASCLQLDEGCGLSCESLVGRFLFELYAYFCQKERESRMLVGFLFFSVFLFRGCMGWSCTMHICSCCPRYPRCRCRKKSVFPCVFLFPLLVPFFRYFFAHTSILYSSTQTAKSRSWYRAFIGQSKTRPSGVGRPARLCPCCYVNGVRLATCCCPFIS